MKNKNQSSEGKGIKKLISKTTCWKYSDRTIIHTKTEPNIQPIYFSDGKDEPFKWNTGGYIDLAPKGTFITRWVKRLWNNKKLKKLLKL